MVCLSAGSGDDRDRRSAPNKNYNMREVSDADHRRIGAAKPCLRA
jgi:hypothetical protein